MTITIDPIAAAVIAFVALLVWYGLRRYADARGVKAACTKSLVEHGKHIEERLDTHDKLVCLAIEEERKTFDRRMADHGETVKRTEIAMGNLRDQFMAELSKFGNALGAPFGRR